MTNEKENQPQILPTREEPVDKAKADETNKTVLEKFDEKADQNMSKIDDAFEKRISASKMAEIALVEVRTMKENEKRAVKSTFETFKKQYQDTKIQNLSEREELASTLLKKAESEADYRLHNIEMVLNMLVKGDYITEAEAVSLKHIMVGVERVSIEDVETQKVLTKLQERKELSDADYSLVINKINPVLLTARDAKPQENFDTTSSGILIGFMNPAQRFKLVEKYMDSPKSGQTGDLIDGFLKTGILTVAQGEELFGLALQKHVVSQTQFDQIYKNQLHNGFYVEEAKKVQEGIQKEVTRISGRYANNEFERLAGTPMVGAAVMAHSFFWILTNVLASGGDFGMMLRNPYLWAAVGEGALALEMTTGSMKKGTGDYGIGAGWISRAIEKISEKEGDLSSVKRNAYNVMGEIYGSYPEFGSYLENGGAQTILTLRKAKSIGGKSGGELAITVDELMKAETNDRQKALLQAAQDHNPKVTLSQINGISEVIRVLEINSQGEFNHQLNYFKESQGLKPSNETVFAGAPAAAPIAVPAIQPLAVPPKVILPDKQ